MGYSPELRERIKKVEETRPERLKRKARGEEYPALTLGEREEILRACCSVEMMQTFLLISDDIMDRSDLRRGSP